MTATQSDRIMAQNDHSCWRERPPMAPRGTHSPALTDRDRAARYGMDFVDRGSAEVASAPADWRTGCTPQAPGDRLLPRPQDSRTGPARQAHSTESASG
jgi:hypothetical protein